LEVAHVDDNHIVGTWRNVFLCLWRHETHAGAIRNLKPVIERVKAANPAGAAMLTVVEPKASMPTPEARDELPRLFKAVGVGIACSGLVFEGIGFRAAAVRALTTTFNLLAAQPFPHRVFAKVSEAEAMFIERLPPSGKGEKLTRGELVLVADMLRRRFDTASKARV
jgi:hypothetical protein